MNVPYDDHMGFRRVARDGTIAIEADVGPTLHNPMGVLHGGVLAGMMDSAMGASMTARLATGQTTTNTELQCRFLRPVTEGRLTATARVVKDGRTMTVWAAEVHDSDGHLIATASSAFLVRHRGD